MYPYVYSTEYISAKYYFFFRLLRMHRVWTTTMQYRYIPNAGILLHILQLHYTICSNIYVYLIFVTVLTYKQLACLLRIVLGRYPLWMVSPMYYSLAFYFYFVVWYAQWFSLHCTSLHRKTTKKMFNPHTNFRFAQSGHYSGTNY